MKKAGLLMLLFVVSLSASGQGPVIDLPFLPTRDTNHIRTIRTYSVDPKTGARLLKSTEQYDPHGYSADTNIRNQYDWQGHLIQQEHYHWVSSIADPMPHRETESKCHIIYAPNGDAQYISNESFSKYHSGKNEYILFERTAHPRLGYWTKYVYLSKASWAEWTDTIRFIREYDDSGHLLRDFCDVENLEGYRDARYSYDSLGRIANCTTVYYESKDSLDYHYDANGVLVSQTGKVFDLGMEADVTVTFRPDGTRKERREHWINYEDPSDASNDYFRFDEHDVLVYWLVYEKEPLVITEYEIEYWK